MVAKRRDKNMRFLGMLMAYDKAKPAKPGGGMSWGSELWD